MTTLGDTPQGQTCVDKTDAAYRAARDKYRAAQQSVPPTDPVLLEQYSQAVAQAQDTSNKVLLAVGEEMLDTPGVRHFLAALDAASSGLEAETRRLIAISDNLKSFAKALGVVTTIAGAIVG